MRGRWFSSGPPVSSTDKTDRDDITEILLKVVLNKTNKQPFIYKAQQRFIFRKHVSRNIIEITKKDFLINNKVPNLEELNNE